MFFKVETNCIPEKGLVYIKEFTRTLDGDWILSNKIGKDLWGLENAPIITGKSTIENIFNSIIDLLKPILEPITVDYSK